MSSVQVVPNKGEMAVVQNENNELIPIRTVDRHCNVIVFKICAIKCARNAKPCKYMLDK